MMSLKHWLRFSLKTLLLVTTVVGCWLGYQLNSIRARQQYMDSEECLTYAEGDAPWQLRILGAAGYSIIYLPEDSDQRDIARAKNLFPEAKVEVWD